MTNKSATAPRLFTTHGTVVYVDRNSGQLRHGAVSGSPTNARLVSDGAHGQVVCETAGPLQPITCVGGACRTMDRVGTGDAPVAPTLFEVIRLDQGWVGLKAEGLFLSAVPDGTGSVALSAPLCRAWENFLLADPRPLPQKHGRVLGQKSLSLSCIFSGSELRNLSAAVKAVESTARCISVDCLYWFSNAPYPGTLPNVEIVNIMIPDFVHFFDDINRVHLHLIPRVVETDFNLIVQPDGFAVNPQAWDDTFWEYDYIGAPWPSMWGGGPYWRGPIVGNGGFSLRSRRLYQALLDIDITWSLDNWLSDERINLPEYYVIDPQGERRIPEDVLICLWYREKLERECGIKFCPPELANKFSVESPCPFTQYWLGRSFGFHGPWAASHYGVKL